MNKVVEAGQAINKGSQIRRSSMCNLSGSSIYQYNLPYGIAYYLLEGCTGSFSESLRSSARSTRCARRPPAARADADDDFLL